MSVHWAERTTDVNRVNLFLYFKDVFGFFIDWFNKLISSKALFLFRSVKDNLKNFINLF